MENKIQSFSNMINEGLYEYFGSYHPEYEILFESMRYSVKNGGKRVRPLLTLLFCDACGGDVEEALPMAEAVEYIHTYSLIHDDLPCMDDDDFRRGKPSNHKVYGEAYALLAGDGLLTAAFEIISDGCAQGLYDSETAVKAINVLSRCAGSRGMIGGQVIDLQNEENPNVTIEILQLLDSLKTGALIEAACVMGCIVAGADEEKIKNARIFAEKLGLAFQIKDDILDVTGTMEKLGKPIGSDAENGKSTYVGILGTEKCQALIDELTSDAMNALEIFPDNTALKEYAEYLAKRDH